MFTYALLQAVSPWDEDTVRRGLHQLVEAEFLYQRGLPPQATYTFKHALIQEAAYQSLLRSTRQQSHQRIAQVLETQFPEIAETQPELLAHHYTEAGLVVQAVHYWQQAGQQAAERSANLEAVQHLTIALSLLATLPETSARAQQELELQLALGSALIATKGGASPEAEQTYAQARALCAQVGETPQLFPTLRGLWRFYITRGALQTAQRALTLSRGEATGVRCLAFAAWTLWCLGYPEQALRWSQEALALAQVLAHPHSLVQTQHFAAYLHHRRREVQAVQAQAEALLSLATTQEIPVFVGYGTCWQGWVLARLGQGAVGLTLLRQGMAAVMATGQEIVRPLCLILLAEAAGHAGQVAEGLSLLSEALGAFEESGRGDLLTEAYRLQGEFLLRQTVPDAVQAEAGFQQALAIAHRQQAISWELRAAMSLARLWQRQGKCTEARELLAPIYGWFTEGFDTADLQETKALLDALA